MRADKSKAIKLRLQGHSYSEIQLRLGDISKSTLSLWLRDLVISDSARSRILKRARAKSLQGLIKRNISQTRLAKERARVVRKQASKEINKLSRRELMLLGTALYWAEGYKRPIVRNGRELTNHPISLTNSDPLLVRTFVRFLLIVCGVPLNKMRASLRIFTHINEVEAINFWSKSTGIPKSNFGRTYKGVSISSMRKRPFNRLPYGVIQVSISDTPLYHRIMGWIDGLKVYAAVAQWQSVALNSSGPSVVMRIE